MSGAEVRRTLGISTATYFRWLKEGRLRGVRAGRDWRFPREAVQALLRPGASAAIGETRDLFARLLAQQGVRKKEVDHMQRAPDALALMLLRQAQESRATSLHIEPAPAGFTIRQRVDGSLLTLLSPLPTPAAHELMADLRRLAGLDDAYELRPAKARFLARVGDRAFDVFAATYPTLSGPSMTLRLLDPATAVPPVDRLGFPPVLCAGLRRAVGRGGLFVVNGPSGSGKTTTLYALLRELVRPEIKVMTAENPVELAIEGVQQAELAEGVTFVDAVKAMLYSEADVAMVAEVRDSETMRLLLGMATAGRTVLTALHAPDAVGALHRMAEITHDSRSLIADNVSGILNQRLVRLTCTACATKEPLAAEHARALGIKSPARRVASGRGCAKCAKTGVRGMTAVGEFLTITPALRRALESGGGLDELRAAAGLSRSLRDDLADRVLAGDVSPAEAVRVLGS